MDTTIIARLERLGRLRADGALTEEEFTAAKTALLGGEPAASAPNATVDGPVRVGKGSALSKTWERRFEFIDAHGLPCSRSHKAALRSVSLVRRSRLDFSLAGMVLGPLYFLYLGLWRPALSIFAGSLIYAVVLPWSSLPESLSRVAWIGPSLIYAMTAVPLYYLKERRGIHRWSPFFAWGLHAG